MNGIPMRFDFTKTLNEQLDTFNYYKDRYIAYEFQISSLIQENKELKGKLYTAIHNEKQASESCRQHRLANQNKKNRLKRREEQIKKLKDNWNSLNEYLENKINDSKLEDDFESAFYMSVVLQEMQELEGGK